MKQASNSTAESKKRTLKNFFITSKLSNNYHRKLIYISFILMSAINLYFINQMTTLNKKVLSLSTNDQESVLEILLVFKKLVVISTLGFLVYFIFMIGFVFIIQYRVAGPTKAILSFIAELKNNNFNYNRALRSGDELGVIMDALVDLQQHLKEKQNKS